MLTKILRTFAIIGGLVLLALLSSSPGGWLYFSPDTYMAERQEERLFYKTEFPIYRSMRTAYRPKLASYLIERGYWKPRRTNTPTWLCVEHWNARWRDGHSSLKRQIFGGGGEDWINWSETHPDMAQVLWPMVERELRAGSSDSRVVQIMLHAQRAQDVEQFKFFLRTDAELDGQ